MPLDHENNSGASKIISSCVSLGATHRRVDKIRNSPSGSDKIPFQHVRVNISERSFGQRKFYNPLTRWGDNEPVENSTLDNACPANHRIES